MFAGGLEGDPARAIGKIDADLVEQRCRRIERRILDRQDTVADRRVIRTRLRAIALHGAEERRAARPLRSGGQGCAENRSVVDRECADEVADGGALDRRGDRLAWHLVDDEEPDGDRGAVLEIAFFEPHRSLDADIAQGGLEEIAHPGIGAEPVGHDRNEPAAGLEAA